MAVFTELSDEDRDSITAAYGMSSLSSVIGIADGDRETTYLFRAGEGEFIVTLFENGAEPLDLELAFETMETLYNNGVPCPKPVRTVHGHSTFQAAGRLVATVSFVPGSATNDATPARCESLGRVMAQIHTILQRSHKRPAADLPTGAVHGALVHQNVFFLGEEVSGIINFRLRHDDALISEVADVLVRWTSRPNGELDQEKVHAVLGGYQSVRRITDAEKAALPGFVLASAARRYASDKRRACLPGAAVLAYESVRPEIVACSGGSSTS
ncbi:phosphotransferase [Microvirga calopogonii]|uniref:phosphotransferase n=1 Tax=Microvirga calopogonii TaxID=2078013 RepID=UPI000E0DB36E|nr:phosphotransferase [Microvirga calopogonii]